MAYPDKCITAESVSDPSLYSDDVGSIILYDALAGGRDKTHPETREKAEADRVLSAARGLCGTVGRGGVSGEVPPVDVEKVQKNGGLNHFRPCI